ncbi:MAG: DUF4390 domain-containing protein [Desulfobacteraceae bacterium]|jgi:hypothetical protein
MTQFKYIICLVTFIACISGQTIAFAQDVKLTNIIVTNTRDDLLLYLTVEGAFQKKMEEAILSGVPATFSFFVILYRSRSWWPNKKIADITVTNKIKYNAMKKEYVVTRSWDGNKPNIVKTLSDAKKLMTEVDSLKIIPLRRLVKGNQYQIQTKAELDKLTLPFYLHHVLFFVSFWDFETDWYTIDFIY